MQSSVGRAGAGLIDPRTGRAATLVVLLGLTGLSLGCGEGRTARTPASAGAGAPTPGGTAVVGVAAGGTTLLPPLAGAALDFELGTALFLGLNYASWRGGALDYEPGHSLGLARTWTLSPERAELTYQLDTRKRWSDGQPIRARDVVFTYGLLADTALALPLSSTTVHIDSVVAVDDSTVTFFFDHAYPGMLFDTGVGIIPEHVYGTLPRESMQGMAGLEPADAEGAAGLVVSGPFRLDTWRPTEMIGLARNDRSVTPALLDRLVVRVVPDEVTRAAELRVGSLDAAQLNSFRQAAALAREEGIRIQRAPQRGYDYIAWNPAAHSAFGDPVVRHALSLAIDRGALIRALDMVGYSEPAWGPYGSLFSTLQSEPPDDPMYDPAEARRLLESAGWVDADGDGVRERGAERFDFELTTSAGNERRESAVQIIERQLADVGVVARIRTEEFNALFGRAIGRDYSAVLLGWQVGLDPDIAIFWGDPSSPLNVVGYDDAETVALIDSAQAQATAAEAAPYWRRAGARVASDYPYAFLWYFDLPLGVGSRLQDVEVDASGFGHTMHRWWIPPASRRDRADP
jgi:peptide/nickel transport system substrate-binding protein